MRRTTNAPLVVTALSLGVLGVCLTILVALEGPGGAVERIGSSSLLAAPAFVAVAILVGKLRAGSS